MRHFKLYLSLLLLMAFGMVGCQDDFDAPPMIVPQAQHADKVNMSILDLKTKYWSTETNYIDTIGLNDANDSIVIKGRVISSDAAGNIYKNLVIQDETAALCVSVNANSLYTTYRVGQEIVIPVTDMFIGKYNTLQQLGYPDYSASYGWQATFMPLAFFQSHAEINGLPDAAQIDTITTTMSALPTTPEGLRQMQSQLVRFNDVFWPEADGKTTYSESAASTSRTLQDDSGNTIIVRNSNYATFKNEILPIGTGSVVGILSYYSGAWQLLLRSTQDCIGFSTSTEGSVDDPYTIDRAIELQGKDKTGWMTGYIVGAVAPEVTNVTSNSDIEWTAPTHLATTLVIGATPETKDIKNCIIMALPQGSALRTAANLLDNPSLLGTQIWVKGSFAEYMGAYGLTGNSGAKAEYKLAAAAGGVTSLFEDFSTSTNIPDGWSNVQVKGNKNWFIKTFNEEQYASMTGYNGTAPFESWLVSPAINVSDAREKILSFKSEVNGYSSTTSTMKVYVLSSEDPASATKTELSCNWATAPASGYSGWAESGDIDLSAFTGTIYIGFVYEATTDANYATWCIDDVKFGEGSSTPTPPSTSGISSVIDDFETMNGGVASGFYTTPFTSTDGWVSTNCNLLSGGEADANPVFVFLGYKTGSTSQYAFGPCLNGRTTSVGSLVSPTILNGCKELKFNYAMPFTETNGVSFRVDIKQDGSVVKSFTVTKTASEITKGEALSETLDVNVSGSFTIEFHNLSPSAIDASNKDRVCIWNVNWTNM